MKRTFFALCLLALVAGSSPATEKPRSGSAVSPDGVNIYATMRGEDDPTLVFVHGWCCDGLYWRDQLEHFAPEFRTVAIDLAGHGASHRNREIYTMEAFGADVVAVLEEFNLRKVILVGHSMGGAVIVEAALAAPDRVIGLIGVDNFQDIGREVTTQKITESVEGMRKDFRRSVYTMVQGMFPADADSLLVNEVAVDMAVAPSLVALSALEEYLTWFAAGGADRIRSLNDPLVNINATWIPTDDEAMRALVPDYRLWSMDGLGHFPMLEDPEGFNATLAEVVAYIEGLAER